MDEGISQFIAISGAPADKAKFFVEASNGDVQAALASYYESEGGEGGASAGTTDADESASAPPGYTGPRTLSGAPAPSLPEGWASGSSSSSASKPTGGSRPTPPTRGGISTFGSLRGEEGTSARGNSSGGGAFRGGIGRIHHDDDDDDDDDAPPNLFAGGERSGLSVQDPEAERRRRMMQALSAAGDAPGGDLVQNILKQAAEGGPPPPLPGGVAQGGGAAQGTLHAFGGRGRTIGDEEEPASQPTAGASSRPRPVTLTSEEEEDDMFSDGSHLPPAVRHLTFWQDGFTIGDSRLYRYDNPQDQAILQAIQSQRAPLSLLKVRPGQEVELRVEKKTEEKYKLPPPPPAQPFGGAGNRLSSPVPNMAAASSSTTTTTAAAAPPASQVHFEVDSSKPTTQLQLRLADGTRLVGRFNHEHTIADIRRYINASRPGMAATSYVLQPSFPPKPIEDESQSIKDAGLLNAVVIQKNT